MLTVQLHDQINYHINKLVGQKGIIGLEGSGNQLYILIIHKDIHQIKGFILMLPLNDY